MLSSQNFASLAISVFGRHRLDTTSQAIQHGALSGRDVMRILRKMGLSAIAVCFFAFAVWPQTHSDSSGRTALRAARLIDGKSETVINNAVILIENGKITAVGSGLQIPADSKFIDLGDATLLPGFIDAH